MPRSRPYVYDRISGSRPGSPARPRSIASTCWSLVPGLNRNTTTWRNISRRAGGRPAPPPRPPPPVPPHRRPAGCAADATGAMNLEPRQHWFGLLAEGAADDPPRHQQGDESDQPVPPFTHRVSVYPVEPSAIAPGQRMGSVAAAVARLVIAQVALEARLVGQVGGQLGEAELQPVGHVAIVDHGLSVLVHGGIFDA